MPVPAYSHFHQWNASSCIITIPAALGKTSKPVEIVAELVETVRQEKLLSAQQVSPRSILLSFTTKVLARAFRLSGVDFRGVHLVPTVAFAKLTSVYVARVPSFVTDDHFVSAFAPYGSVKSIRSLRLKNYTGISSGTRLIRMAITSPIPFFLKVWDFPATCTYAGQQPQCFKCREIGHKHSACPAPSSTRRHRKRKRQEGSAPPPARDPETASLPASGSSGAEPSTKLTKSSVVSTISTSTQCKIPPPSSSIGLQTIHLVHQMNVAQQTPITWSRAITVLGKKSDQHAAQRACPPVQRKEASSQTMTPSPPVVERPTQGTGMVHQIDAWYEMIPNTRNLRVTTELSRLREILLNHSTDGLVTLFWTPLVQPSEFLTRVESQDVPGSRLRKTDLLAFSR